MLDSHGDIGASAGGPDGLFNADTRYLARLELVLDEVQPLLLGSNLRDDNSALTVDLTNPDVYRNGRIVLHEGHAAHRAHDLPVARNGLSAHRRAESQRKSGELRSDAAVRQRLRRSVRGARRASSAPGHRLQQIARSCRRRARIYGARRQIAQHGAAVRSAPDAACGERRDLSSRSGAATGRVAVRCCILQQAGRAETGAVLSRPARASPRDAPVDERRHQHRNVEQYLQRGAVPVDGRPQHADDGYAAGTVSLCGHSLVFDDVRPRRNHHRAADAVDRPAGRARRVEAARVLSGQDGRSACGRGARQDPARNARRRDGRAARGAVCAILRQRRCDAAVRAAGRSLCRTHRRR